MVTALHGDWYGSPVNLASRVTSAAPPGAVRVIDSTCKAIGDPADIEWSAAEARHLKGIRGEVLLYGARRVPSGESCLSSWEIRRSTGFLTTPIDPRTSSFGSLIPKEG